MSGKSPTYPADLLKEAKRLQAQEAQLKRDRVALAKKLIQAGRDLGGDDLELEVTAKPKRRYTRRRRAVRAPPPPPATPNTPQVAATAPQPLGRRLSAIGWTATMLQIIRDANRPLTYAELKAETAKTHLGPKLLRTDKSFYGAIAKLETREVAVRHGGRVFAPEVYERYMRDVDAGIVKDEPILNSGSERVSPTKTAVLQFLGDNVRGARISEIVNNLEKRPELNVSGNKNGKTAVYNLIARLVRRDVLVREGDIITLPRKPNGALHTEPAISQAPM
jgi:hypothetical protein